MSTSEVLLQGNHALVCIWAMLLWFWFEAKYNRKCMWQAKPEIVCYPALSRKSLLTLGLAGSGSRMEDLETIWPGPRFSSTPSPWIYNPTWLICFHFSFHLSCIVNINKWAEAFQHGARSLCRKDPTTFPIFIIGPDLGPHAMYTQRYSRLFLLLLISKNSAPRSLIFLKNTTFSTHWLKELPTTSALTYTSVT